jgi:molybdopterin molybdotransferase
VITVEEHLSRCLAAVGPLPVVDLPLLDALGHVLAGDATSAVELPGFDNSSMDGFALRAADVAGAGADAPTRLAVSGEVAAGGGRPERLAPGTAVRIMTGAPLPDGADSVVPVEWTGGWTDGDAAAGVVAVRQAPDAGAFVRRAGEDVSPGEVVVAAGTVLTARHLSLLAATGHAALAVHRAPRVAVLSSGSELVPPGRPLGFGQVHDSNGYGLAAAATALGAQARYLGIVPDDAAAVRAALAEAAAGGDLLLTSGGVSAGVYDVVKEALTELGGVRFDRVAMQPGMPQGFGTIDGTPVLTLPGNPVSSMVSFEVFVRPVLRALAGVPVPAQRREVIATAAVGWSSPAGRRQFVRGVLSPGESGPVVAPVGAQGSHLVADLAAATCLAVVPEDVTRVSPGDVLRCLPLEGAA